MIVSAHIRRTEYTQQNGGDPILGSGCGSLIADKSPSSATQLPIPAALHARFPTLFVDMIHEKNENVNPFFQNLPLFTVVR